MQNTDNNQSGEQRWKSRYDRLRNDFELFEGSTATRFRHVLKIIENIQSVSPVDDPAFNSAVKALLSAIHDDKPSGQIDVQIEAFNKKTAELAREKTLKLRDTADHLQALLQSLASMPLSRNASKHISKLSRRLKKARNKVEDANEFDINHWLHQIVALNLGDSIPATQADEQSQPGKRKSTAEGDEKKAGESVKKQSLTGAIQNLFKRSQKDNLSAESAVPTDINPVRESNKKATAGLAGQESSAGEFEPETPDEEHPDKSLPTAEIAAILLELLADIEIPESMKSMASELYTQLEMGINDEEVIPVLDDSVEVVVSALRRDQAEFEDFLQELDERLVFLNDFIDGLHRHIEGSPDMAGHLSSNVAHQVSDIRKELESASSVNELKQKINSKLDYVSSLLTEYASRRGEESQSLKRRVDDLQNQIVSLEMEAESARQSLARQREKLLRDPLTGIANREAYTLRIADEYARWRRYQRPLSFVVADIDEFKSINDSFGHGAGDKVLILVARLLRQQLRESDFIARVGGEEFAILLPETALSEAKVAVEKLRNAVADSPLNFRSKPLQLTCSFGLTQFTGDDTAESVFNRADRALYKAKDNGKNCVVSL